MCGEEKKDEHFTVKMLIQFNWLKAGVQEGHAVVTYGPMLYIFHLESEKMNWM